MADKEVRGITPVLQARLLAETDKVCDALDDFDLRRAYLCLKTLITICPPEVQDGGVLETLNKLDRELVEAKKADGIDEVSRRITRHRSIIKVLKMRVRPLFFQTFRALYKGNYLALYVKGTQSNIPPREFEKALEQ